MATPYISALRGVALYNFAARLQNQLGKRCGFGNGPKFVCQYSLFHKIPFLLGEYYQFWDNIKRSMAEPSSSTVQYQKAICCEKGPIKRPAISPKLGGMAGM